MKLITGLSAILGLAQVVTPSLAFSGAPTPTIVNREREPTIDWVRAAMACQKYGLASVGGEFAELCRKLRNIELNAAGESYQGEVTADAPAHAKAAVEPH